MRHQEYVLGFMFDEHAREVLLIRKLRPSWQAGRLNGVGGHIENTDPSADHAMCREFTEETSVHTEPHDWSHFLTLTWPLPKLECSWPSCNSPRTGRCYASCKCVCHATNRTGRVHCFRAFAPHTLLRHVISQPPPTDEPLEVWSVSSLNPNTPRPLIVPNLSWIVPLAAYRADTYEPIVAKFASPEC